jgi:hypothetical protein
MIRLFKYRFFVLFLPLFLGACSEDSGPTTEVTDTENSDALADDLGTEEVVDVSDLSVDLVEDVSIGEDQGEDQGVGDVSDVGVSDVASDVVSLDQAIDGAGFDWGDQGNIEWDLPTDAAMGDAVGLSPYQFIRIDDDHPISATEATSTSGVDIYGIELIRADTGETLWAEVVHVCAFGIGDNSFAADCTMVLGEPDGSCLTDGEASYVSLGGPGGSLVVTMEGNARINQGDIVRVLECGADENPEELDERYIVLIGSSTDPEDPNWGECGTGYGSDECVVPLSLFDSVDE